MDVYMDVYICVCTAVYICVWDKDDNHNNGFKRPLAYSWIHPTDIELKDGNLWILS